MIEVKGKRTKNGACQKYLEVSSQLRRGSIRKTALKEYPPLKKRESLMARKYTIILLIKERIR